VIVEAYDIDVMREPKLVSADERYSGYAVTEVLDQLRDDVGCVVVIACGRPCRFLEENRCTIYPTRPNACVVMPAGEDECQRARRGEGLLPLVPSRGDLPDR
jgi:Fe-S-cluster containining protein